MRDANAALLKAQGGKFAPLMDGLEQRLDDWTAMRDRLDALDKRAAQATGDVSAATKLLASARTSLAAEDIAQAAEAARQAEGALDLLARRDDAVPAEKQRSRWADAAERFDALAAFDPKLRGDAGGVLDAAEKALGGDQATLDALLDKLEKRLDAAVVTIRARIDTQATDLDKTLKVEAQHGADIAEAMAMLDAAAKEAQKGDYVSAHAALDKARVSSMDLQDRRVVDIAQTVRPIWSKAIATYEAALTELQKNLVASTAPEAKVLATLGVTGWIKDVSDEIASVIDRLTAVPAGPGGQVGRLGAVATFRTAQKTLCDHPVCAALPRNPWGVAFDPNAMRAALVQMEKQTLTV